MKCLIVVDYQVDFVSGSLGNATAAALDADISARIRRAREEGEDVIFTLDTHDLDYLSTGEGKHLPVPHCIRGTGGHCLYGKTARERCPEDWVFLKDTFGSKGLYNYLLDMGYETVELCGVVTNICVMANAVLAKTALPKADIRVNAALCASNDPALHQKALDVMASLQIEILE